MYSSQWECECSSVCSIVIERMDISIEEMSFFREISFKYSQKEMVYSLVL